jgi:hypothetical protein
MSVERLNLVRDRAVGPSAHASGGTPSQTLIYARACCRRALANLGRLDPLDSDVSGVSVLVNGEEDPPGLVEMSLTSLPAQEVLVANANALLTLHGRRLLVDRGWWAGDACRQELGISRRCAHR